MVLGDGVDWDEVGELLNESYCLLAPKRLARHGADDRSGRRSGQFSVAVRVRLSSLTVVHSSSSGPAETVSPSLQVTVRSPTRTVASPSAELS